MEDFRFVDQNRISEIFELLKAQNPEPKPELFAPNDFTLLVSVMLSAQATDKSVNIATEPLYKIACTPEQFLELGQEKLESYIKSIGLYRAKSKHVLETCKILVEKFNSKIPDTREELESLPGVGRKTANVILNVVFKQNTMPVDTHIFRVAHRIGFSDGKTPELVEKELLLKIPEKYLYYAHHWLLLHGRYVCVARKPHCEECIIQSKCCKNIE